MIINKQRLECEMVRQNVGYNELGHRMGISSAETLRLIDTVERERDFTIEDAHRICNALNVDPEQII